MDLSNLAFSLAIISTWIAGAVLTRFYFKKRAEKKMKRVPVRIRSLRRY